MSENFLATEPIVDADINYCIQCPHNTQNSLKDFYTLLIDLSQFVEEIRKEVYHRALSEINSYVSNQEFEHKVLYDPTDKDLKNFIRLFNTFASEKKIRPAETFRLKAYKQHGILAVSYIRQNEKFLFINFYRITKERAANIYSFGVKDPAQEFNSSQLGRAHRSLHWLDMLEFKKAGAHYYDFCGWYDGTENADLLNVNKFKEQFTKNKVKEYSGVIYKRKLLVLLLKLMR